MMNRPRLTVDELVQSIFENREDSLPRQFEEWVRTSKRFRAFAEQYHDKIRKKYRLAPGEDGLQSLAFELEIAYRILQDERCVLEYEKYTASRQRGPDFTITFRINTLINLEVTRIRPSAGQEISIQGKLVNAVCDKVGQMQPNMVNILIVSADNSIAQEELTGAMKGLRLNAEQKNEAFLAARRFADAADFLRQFQRLSGIVARNQPDSGAAEANVVWLNSLAKRPMAKEIVSLLQKL